MIVVGRALGKPLIDGERQSAFGGFGFFDCGVGGGPSASALSIEGFASPVAFDIHFQDRSVMDEAVDGRERHGLIGEDFAPLAERLVGGDQHGSPLIARGDQLEQHAGLGLILGDVGDVVEDEEVVAVEFGDRAFKRQFAAGDLKPLHKIGGAGEQHPPAVFDEGETERGREMAFAHARRAEQQDVGPFTEPRVARGQRHHLGL